MKYWIGFAVVAVHVVLLSVFFGPWSSRGTKASATTVSPGGMGTPATLPPPGPTGAPAPAAVAPTVAAAVPGTPVPPAGTALAAVGQGNPGAVPVPGTPQGIPPFSPTFFTPAIRPLPAKLETAAAACRAGVLVDWSARRILWAKAETRAVPIASLTKMMTVLVVMQELGARTDVDLNTPIPVTREAALVGGRQVWLDPRETFPLQDILRCTLIHSANDAAFLLAQRFAGSEVAFVKRMQDCAAAQGLTGFTFHNAHGLPEGPTQMENTGRPVELAYLAGRLLQFPRVVEWTSTRVSYLEPRVDGKRTQLVTTNRLVARVTGVNGMKTGFTDKSGYCLAATCDRGGRQVIAIATGCPRSADRDSLVTALIEWAYSVP